MGYEVKSGSLLRMPLREGAGLTAFLTEARTGGVALLLIFFFVDSFFVDVFLSAG